MVVSGETEKNPDLSLDLQLVILSFLNPESVLRFRTVSKIWNSQTCRDQFVSEHLRRQKTLQSNTVLFTSCRTLSVCNFQSATRTVLQTLPDPFPFYFLVVGSCDGFLCVLDAANRRRVCLFNPVTRDYVCLPRFGRELDSDASPAVRFGFDCVSRVYKVIVWCVGSDQMGLVIFVCDVPPDGHPGGWRIVGSFADQISPYRDVVVEGKLYWLVRNSKKESEEVNSIIMSFDLHDEKLRQVPVDMVDGDMKRAFFNPFSSHLSMEELKGRLAICAELASPGWRRRICVWVMNSGKEEVWALMVSLEYSLNLRSEVYKGEPKCFCYMKEDNKLVIYYRDLIL